MKILDIAKACHQVNRTYCQALGDTSQPDWDDAPDWQKQSALSAVRFALQNPEAGPDSQHVAWLADKKAAGWSYGPVKDPVKKEHPCMVPYEELSPSDRAKDTIFLAVVKGVASLVPS